MTHAKPKPRPQTTAKKKKKKPPSKHNLQPKIKISHRTHDPWPQSPDHGHQQPTIVGPQSSVDHNHRCTTIGEPQRVKREERSEREKRKTEERKSH